MTHVDNPFQSLATLSICTGIRGLERGVERVIGPLRTIAYVEIEAFVIENLLAGMESGMVAPAPIWADLKTFPWRHFRGKLGLLMGGYPCPPFSTAGKRLGAADPRHLWPHIERGIRTAKPLCCFFENVGGHLSLGFEEVAHSLRAMGYAVEAGIYTAEEVGAPHRRARLFILAILDDAKGERSGEARRLFERSKERITGSGEAVADAGSAKRRSDDPGRRRCDEVDLCERGKETTGLTECGEELANASRRIGSGAGGGERRQSKLCSTNELADSCGEGPQGGQQFGPHGTGGEEKSHRSTSKCRAYDKWPARPGEPQHDWEEPRAIESRLGCTVNGYNFREDLLRALGNGVVEQTAELAFRDLLRKHFEIS